MAQRRITDLNSEQRLIYQNSTRSIEPVRYANVSSTVRSFKEWPWLCNALVSKNGQGASVRMLDMILLAHGEPVAWFYTNKQGVVSKKSKSACNRAKVMDQLLLAAKSSSSDISSACAAISLSDSSFVAVVGEDTLRSVLLATDPATLAGGGTLVGDVTRPSSAASSEANTLVSSKSAASAAGIVLGRDVRNIQSIHAFVCSRKRTREGSPPPSLVNYTVEYSFSPSDERPVCTCYVLSTQVSGARPQTPETRRKGPRNLRPKSPYTSEVRTVTTRSLATSTNSALREATLEVVRCIERNRNVFICSVRCEFVMDVHNRLWFVRAVQAQTSDVQVPGAHLLLPGAREQGGQASTIASLYARSIPPQERLLTMHEQQLAHQEHFARKREKLAASNIGKQDDGNAKDEEPSRAVTFKREPPIASPFLVNASLSVTGFVDAVLNKVDVRSKTLDNTPGMELGKIQEQLKKVDAKRSKRSMNRRSRMDSKRPKQSHGFGDSKPRNRKNMIVQEEEKVRDALIQVQRMEQIGNTLAAGPQSASDPAKNAFAAFNNTELGQPATKKSFFASNSLSHCAGDFCQVEIETLWEHGESIDASQSGVDVAGTIFKRPKSAGSTGPLKRSDMELQVNIDGTCSKGVSSPNGSSTPGSTNTTYIMFKEIAQARNEKSLVEKLLSRLEKGQPGDYYSTSIAGGIKDSKASDAYLQLIGKNFPSQYYRQVRVCQRCHAVYNKIDEARTAAIDRIKTWESKTKQANSKPKHDSNENARKDLRGGMKLISSDSGGSLSNEEALELGASRIAQSLLGKKDIAEFRSLKKPPPGVLLVSKALFTLLTGQDISWERARKLMANGERFLGLLMDFDIQNVPTKRMTMLKEFVTNPLFRPSTIRPVSNSAATFCSWILGTLKGFFLQLGNVYPSGLGELRALNLASEMEKLGKFSSFDQSAFLKSISDDQGQASATSLPQIPAPGSAPSRPNSRDSNSRGSSRPSSASSTLMIPAPSYLTGGKCSNIETAFSISLTDKLKQQRQKRDRRAQGSPGNDPKSKVLSPIHKPGMGTSALSSSPPIASKKKRKVPSHETAKTNSQLEEFNQDINDVEREASAGYYTRGPKGLSVAQQRAITPTEVSFNRHDSTAKGAKVAEWFSNDLQSTPSHMAGKKLTHSERRAQIAKRKVQNLQMQRLHGSTKAQGEGNDSAGNCTEFICNDGHTILTYQVLGFGSLDAKLPNLVVVNDFFDTLEAVQIFLEPLLRQRPGCQALVFNCPGQAFTKYGDELQHMAPSLNNELSSRCLHQLLQHLEGSGEFVTSYKPFFVVGFGNGANVGLCFSADFAEEECYQDTFKGLVSVNGFARVDKQLAAVLHSSASVFDCFPPTRPDLPVSYFTRFLFSDGYVKRVDPDLILNLYTAVMNPISTRGRVAICNGALKHRNLSKEPRNLRVPIIIVQSTDNVLVNPTNVDPFIAGRVASHLWSHQLQNSSDGRLLTGLGQKGTGQMKTALSRTDATFVIWVKSGHEVRQEKKKQMLNILLSLVDSYGSCTDENGVVEQLSEEQATESKEEVSDVSRYLPKATCSSQGMESETITSIDNGHLRNTEDEFERALRRHKQKAKEQREIRKKSKEVIPVQVEKQGTPTPEMKTEDAADNSITFSSEEKEMLKQLGMKPDAVVEPVTSRDSVPDDETILERKIELLRKEQEERRKKWEEKDNERIQKLQKQLEDRKSKRVVQSEKRWENVEVALEKADGLPLQTQMEATEQQVAPEMAFVPEVGRPSTGASAASIAVPSSSAVLPGSGMGTGSSTEETEVSSNFPPRPASAQSQDASTVDRPTTASTSGSRSLNSSSRDSSRPATAGSRSLNSGSRNSSRPGTATSSKNTTSNSPAVPSLGNSDQEEALVASQTEPMIDAVSDSRTDVVEEENQVQKIQVKHGTKVIIPNPTELTNVFNEMEKEDEKQKRLGILKREEFERVKLEMQEAERKRLQKIEALKTDELRQVREAAAVILQRTYRGFLDRSRFTDLKYAAHITKQKNEAAQKIQAIQRGRIERRRVAVLRDLHTREQIEGEAVRLIQRIGRGRKGRNVARQRRIQCSTLTIQRVFRGHQGRGVARLQKLEQESRIREFNCATKIQSVWRMREDRERYLTVQLRDLAAAQIQRVYRGVRGRRAAERKKEWEKAKPGPERIELGIRLIEESKLAFESQQEEIDALHRAQERAETQVNKIHAGLRESEKELAVLEQELQDVDHLDRTLHEMTHQKEVLEQSIMSGNAPENARGANEGANLVSSRSLKNTSGKAKEGNVGDNIRDRDKVRATQAYQLEMAMHVKRAERDRKKKALEAEFAGVHLEVQMKKAELARLEENIQTMEATRKRKEREFQRLQRNLMELLEEQKQELDNIREKGIELETATATSAAAAAATAHKAKENEKRSKEMFNSTEELMKFQFMSMSLSYFSSMNMLKNLRDMNKDTSIAAITSSAETAAAAAAATAAANLPDLAHLRLGGASALVDAATRRRQEEAIDHKRRIQEAQDALAQPFPDEVTTWTVDDVCRWLDTLSLSQYKEAFREASVDGAFLLDLRPEDMRDILGMAHTLHVQKVVVMLNKIRPLSDKEIAKQNAVLWEKRGEAARQSLEQQAEEIRIPDVEVVFSQIRNGRFRKVEDSLNRGFDVDTCDIYGNTALIIACQNVNKRIAELLLNRGANINHQNNQGNTPLHYGMAYDPEGAIGEFLIGRGADDTLENKVGLSPYDGIE